MATLVSPGISVSEVDLTTTATAVSTTEGAIGGFFSWGPIGKIGLIDSEDTLVSRYGKPTDDNYETFFSAASFLAYSNALYVSRAAVTEGFSNTLSTVLASNTTATIDSLNTDIEIGHGVYGAGIENGTTVTNVTANSSHTIVELSSNATVSGTRTVNFYNTDYTFSAVANSSSAPNRAGYIIKNIDHLETVNIPAGVEFVAKYPGDFGNSLKVSVCASGEQFSSSVDPFNLVANSTLSTNSSVIPSIGGISIDVNDTSANVFIANSSTLTFSDTYVLANTMRSKFIVGDYIEVGNNSIGRQQMKIKTISALANANPLSPTGEVYFNLEFEQPLKLSTNYAANTVKRNWEYFNVVDATPGTSAEVVNAGSSAVDQLSVVVVDEDGKFTGTSGSVLEVHRNLSRVPGAKNDEGATNYYRTVINENSRYVWSVNDITGAPSANASTVATVETANPYTKSFVGAQNGVTESTMPMSAMAQAYDMFADTTSIDVSLIITGKSIGINGAQLTNYLVDNISETRLDAITFSSPPRSAVVGLAVDGFQSENVIAWRDNVRASSYLFMDSGYKQMYDKYNDEYRWVPMNGDTAGLTARTANTNDAWWSPAGFNRGNIKNVVRLAWNPKQAERDNLYKKDVNPIVSFPGQGTVLYGDKTGLAKASAFSRINVRRLFIILRKSISKSAQNMLFEFNDEFTRAQFRNLVEPFLRDIKGRRGIQDYFVKCDEENNTGEVIDQNRFVGDIYVKPARSINYINLSFVAVRSDVTFSEVVGQF